MTNQKLGMSMGNRECKWVRARLPLWVGDGCPDAIEGNGKGRDLVAEDCREIERHLAVCTCCRGHHFALEQAFGALTAASTLTPVDPHVPSLWPILEHRIAEQDAIATSRQSQAIFGLADRLTRTWTVRDRKQPRLGSIMVYGSVASLLVTLVTLAIARRHWVDAESMIAGNTSPLAYMDAPTNSVDETSSKPSDPDDDGELPGNHLAEADPVRLPEASTGTGPGVSPPKSAIQSRLGYDLDHGTLVAPDTRESKPIY